MTAAEQRQLAISLGLVDDASALASPAMDEIARKFKAGEITAYDATMQVAALRAEMEALRDRTVTVTVNTVYPQGVPPPGDYSPGSGAGSGGSSGGGPGGGPGGMPNGSTNVIINGWQGNAQTLAAEIDRQNKIRELMQ
jgi:hypothetical protein